MFEKLEQLAKDNKKISDFHIRAGSPLAYRQTGEIIKVQEVIVTAQDLKDLLSMNCNEHELNKFEKTHELDTSVTLSGLRFRANFIKRLMDLHVFAEELKVKFQIWNNSTYHKLSMTLLIFIKV